MTDLEDRLRQDLPALADLLLEGQAAQPEKAADAIAESPTVLVDLGVQPPERRRTWSAIAAVAAAAAALAVAAALLINTSDESEVIVADVAPAERETAGGESDRPLRQTGTDPAQSAPVEPEPVEPEPLSLEPEPVEPAPAQPVPVEPEPLEPVEPEREPVEPEPEQELVDPEPEPDQPGPVEPEPGTGSDDGSPRPGEGVDVIAGRADWHDGYFRAALYRRLLEELGYNVSDPAQLEMAPGDGYMAMALGDMDYWQTAGIRATWSTWTSSCRTGRGSATT